MRCADAGVYSPQYGISENRSMNMPETLIISSRGQLTLPAEMRKYLGIEPGGALIIEGRNGELTLRPAAVFGLEAYTDEQITHWGSEDALSLAERKRMLAKLRQS